MESRKYGEAALPPESLLLLFEHDIEEDTLQTPTEYMFPDQERKMRLVERIRKNIAKLELKPASVGFENEGLLSK